MHEIIWAISAWIAAHPDNALVFFFAIGGMVASIIAMFFVDQ